MPPGKNQNKRKTGLAPPDATSHQRIAPSALHRYMIEVSLRRAYACSINHYIVSFSMMLFLRNFERFYNLHAYHGRVGGNQLPPVNLLLPRMTGRNMRPHVIYFTNWPPLRLRWAHYFRMRDHGSSLFSAVKNLHFSRQTGFFSRKWPDSGRFFKHCTECSKGEEVLLSLCCMQQR